MLRRNKPVAVAVGVCILFLLLVTYPLRKSGGHGPDILIKVPSGNPQNKTVALVVASLKSEDTSWLAKYFHQWQHNIYVVDDPHSNLKIPKNKGREAMVYLTYIIDHYDTLPEIMLFLHAGRWQWHNDDPDYDGYAMLSKVQLEHIRESGYVSLRCAWVLGCPVEIRPLNIAWNSAQNKDVAKGYKEAFQELFPGMEVPEEIGAPCCAQFAATREAVRGRPKDDYIRYREWLLAADLEDRVSGRVLEYSWHIIFGKKAVHCPSAPDCYCKLYGLCNLKCETDQCNGRYTLPPYSVLPKGWPLVGWAGEQRPFTGPM